MYSHQSLNWNWIYRSKVLLVITDWATLQFLLHCFLKNSWTWHLDYSNFQNPKNCHSPGANNNSSQGSVCQNRHITTQLKFNLCFLCGFLLLEHSQQTDLAYFKKATKKARSKCHQWSDVVMGSELERSRQRLKNG